VQCKDNADWPILGRGAGITDGLPKEDLVGWSRGLCDIIIIIIMIIIIIKQEHV